MPAAPATQFKRELLDIELKHVLALTKSLLHMQRRHKETVGRLRVRGFQCVTSLDEKLRQFFPVRLSFTESTKYFSVSTFEVSKEVSFLFEID